MLERFTIFLFLPKDPVVFCGTLRENLDPLNLHSDQEIWTALEHAHLKSFVQSLKEGLEYECGEGGESLRLVFIPPFQ